MNGIILYADDDVLTSKTSENELFQKFNSSQMYSVLPITNLEDLEKTISCVSTFRALLLDWSFKRPNPDIDMSESAIMPEDPLDILKKNKIYAMVYIYSREDLPDTTKEELKQLYGAEKIFFEKKSGDPNNVDREFEKICVGISDFENKNKHMEIPFLWSQSINKSAQAIFRELEQADPDWINEIKKTAEEDKTDPYSEIIGIFQNLLNESLIQDDILRKSLLSDVSSGTNDIPKENIAKLYRRVLYTKRTKNAPMMTGDIYQFDNNEYGILITPECDVSRSKDSYEFLMLNKHSSDDLQERKQKEYKKNRLNAGKIFNQDSISRHILTSFPFEENQFDSIAVIEFCTAFKNKTKEELEGIPVPLYKLNSPYIHQLRQRFVAYLGRYGVPAIPESLRQYHLVRSEENE